ncbi:hypothetical protein [Agrococcus sp. ARC_14]|uniref:hypothetical protein n=1 Tax=Agrococcus sp. ARC_14 TaxID=2919927 RepID=UPI001F06029F|nr:hypothetical protein [Agrococcus sp. ARC_14]
MTVHVGASLWSTAPAGLDREARRLVAAGIDRLHWDFSDGTIGPAGGFTASQASHVLDLTGAVGEAHLMTTDPEHGLDAWLACCDIIAVHRRAPRWRATVDRVAEAGRQAVVAVESRAELTGLDPSLGVLVMSVRPGHAGSGFDADALDVVRAASTAGHELVGVDGSVTPEIGRTLIAAGATWLVSGTSITAAADAAEWIASLGA